MPVPLMDILFETSNSDSSDSGKRMSKKKVWAIQGTKIH
jgi:hypothetical protein